MSALSNTKLFADVDKELHDLCQPLTNASCFLELGQMAGDELSLHTAVDGALVECKRMATSVTRMRQRLLELLDETSGQ
jgi:signal transduction histidine kinase